MNNTDAQYSLKVVKYFVVAAVIWAVAGMTIGAILAAQLYWPALNFDSEYFQFGRLRPLHTSGVIYGFVGNMLMGLLSILYNARASVGYSIKALHGWSFGVGS